MRTLKKSLALVLALVMLLGLGVVGASADNALDNYTDADEIGDAYLEAVGVLTGLGIVDGMTETTIVPQATYTRAQAAKIITTMVLGVNGAKSCVASYAPFDDVAANHWAAGYIAFCKEQGIIDGVTDTTFDPEGTLTGYQWAKMLLAAVGFNANNELEGSSWSLNTARIGHEVGLFDGDLAGADHTPLRREQAMLYAFNTLTGVRQVTYTANGDNYVYNIRGYEWADGTGYTLGQAVFGLEGYTGIIVANEGTGADYTVLSKNYTNTSTSRIASVVADTGLDMMYHAARIWTVVDGHGTIGTSDDELVSVYVYDLAKVTESACNSITKARNDNASKVGNNSFVLGSGAKEYDYYFIDNTAYAAKSYADLTVKYSMGELGVADAVKDTTVIAGKAVDNDDIWTNVSDIAKFSTVVYTNINGIYYVYPTSATTGTVKSYDNTTKTYTLTDGTKIAASVFYEANGDVIGNVLGNTFTFRLDSHGHYYDITRSGVANLHFYTGEFRVTSDFGSYHGEHAYVAQFINVETGAFEDYAVGSDFILSNNALRGQGFYDIGVADANGLYHPGKNNGNGSNFSRGVAVSENDNVYSGEYAVDINVPTVTNDRIYLNANTNIISGFDAKGTKAYLDKDVKVVVATGTGSGVSVVTYNSLAELAAAYPGGNVTFDMAALTLHKSTTNDYACSVIFGYIGKVISSGDYLFLADDYSNQDWSAEYTDAGDIVYTCKGSFYLNGTPVTVTVDSLSKIATLNRGFYSFTVTNGVWAITGLDAGATMSDYVGIASVSASNGQVWLSDRLVSDSAVVVDCREDYKDTESKVDSAAKLAEQFRNETISVAYTYNSNGVNVIYVLDSGWKYNISADLSNALKVAGWEVVSVENDTDVAVAGDVTITLKNSKLELATGANYNGINFTVTDTAGKNWSASNATATVNADGNLVVTVPSVTVRERVDTTVTINTIPVTLTVSLRSDEGQKWDTVGATNKVYTANLGETQTVAMVRNEDFNTSLYKNAVISTVDNNVNLIKVPCNVIDAHNVTFTYGPLTANTTIYFWGISD